MGLFDFLKKGTGKGRAATEITLEQLEPWLKGFIKLSGMDIKIAILKRDVTSKIRRLNELLNDLEYAHLKDEKVIPERMKSIFEGNRKAFLEKVRAFILELKVPDDPEEVDDFLAHVSGKLNALSEETQKNYFVLREFIEDHVQPVASKIKDIDGMLRENKTEFERTPLAKIRELREQHRRYFLLLKETEKMREELEHTLFLKNLEAERKSKFDAKLNQLKQTKAYEEYVDLQGREKAIQESLARSEQRVRDLFSKLEHALKKHNRERESELLEKYLEGPIDALVSDAGLLIVRELEHVRENIRALSLKKEKEDSVVGAISELSEDRVRALRKDIADLREELCVVKDRFRNNLFERNIREREGWIDSVNKNIEAMERKQRDIEDLIGKMNPENAKQKMRDIIKFLDPGVELK